MNEIEFREFDKIPRLFRDMTVTEKIDGTNAAVGFEPVEGSQFPLMYCQSRKRIITRDDDNFGFARWAYDNYEALWNILGYGLHFGEWWGSGIQRSYGLDHKRFSLFNTHRWGWLDIPEARAAHDTPDQLHVVPVLRQYTFSTSEVIDALDELEQKGSQAAPGFMKPEGVVVYHSAGNHLFKATFEMDRHKGDLSLAA